MPLSGPSSYVETADEFIVHWTSVNDDRAANTLDPILLQAGYTLANFQTDRDAVDAAVTAAESTENALEVATGNLKTMKENLKERLGQFRSAIELHLKETAYLKAHRLSRRCHRRSRSSCGPSMIWQTSGRGSTPTPASRDSRRRCC